MRIQLLLIGLSALVVAAVPMFTNLTITDNSTLVERDDDLRHLHEYLPPNREIRCDIDDIGPTAHGDGIAQIVNKLKSFQDEPPVMGPGMRQRAGCYFGAVVWWEALRYNTQAIAMDNWDMIWRAVQDIKGQCIHEEWPVLPCCQELKHWQVSGIAQYDDYVVWIVGGEKACAYKSDLRPEYVNSASTRVAAPVAVAAATPGL